MATVPDTWSEVCKVAIAGQGDADVQFAAITETVDLSIGDKEFDVINTVRGGRLVKFTPQEPTEITLEAYPLSAGTPSGTTGTGFFDLFNTASTASPYVISNDRTRDKYRLAVLWCTDDTKSPGDQIGSPAAAALRVVAADGYFTSVKPSFTDGVLKFTVKYKTPAFDKNASSNVKIESVDGSATMTLATLTTYTSTIKWA